jgi:antitoxin VapB
MDTLVFNSGNSQAVRIPKEFRLKTKVVTILKKGKDLILREKQPLSWNEIYNMPGDPEFQLERKDNCLPQTRDLF